MYRKRQHPGGFEPPLSIHNRQSQIVHHKSSLPADPSATYNYPGLIEDARLPWTDRRLRRVKQDFYTSVPCRSYRGRSFLMARSDFGMDPDGHYQLRDGNPVGPDHTAPLSVKLGTIPHDNGIVRRTNLQYV